MSEVKDVYNNESKFKSWLEYAKKDGIEGINKTNSKILIQYLEDMQGGVNLGKGAKKGGRSYIRLNSSRFKIMQIIKALEKAGYDSVLKAKQEPLNKIFNDMVNGITKKNNGEEYKCPADYAKDFKAFWHWVMRVNKTKKLSDITEDLNTAKEENNFVFFTKEELDRDIQPYFSQDEQVMNLFMFDTIIRSPTELMNVKVSDFHNDFKELAIREETAKTFGRTIKILLCSEEIKKYVRRKELKQDDFLFNFSPYLYNNKLQKIAKQVWGNKLSKGGKPYSALTMYDFRHSGAIAWRLGAYSKKIDALMYRGGWNNLDMLNYYTKKLGMKDTIEKDDLLIETDKHELEKRLEKIEKINAVFAKTIRILYEKYTPTKERKEDLSNLNELFSKNK